MTFSVRFTPGARKDLRSIHAYISGTDSMANADYVAREIVRTALSLRELPNRGEVPPELRVLGKRSYRQIFFKPYRILYRVKEDTVHIAVIADGRRDMASLLTRRLHES